jgi:aminoglycoside adenylyltransferase-like protein/nucleotidyltransferase-like protein
MNSINSEVYPELASVLQQFVASVHNALRSNFLGAYLVGSLATGDFDLDSDVDFLILTKTEVGDAEVRSLQTIHVDIHALGCYPAEHLEGSYLSTDLLNRADLVGVERLWYVDNGSTSLERSVHDNQWHVRWILRERGITIIGPDPKTLMHAIPAEALRTEAVDGLQKLKSHFVAAIDQPPGWFNMRFGQSFAVLTSCRMLHTCQTGTVQSKLSAVRWAEQSLDPTWRELIRKAWTERIGARFGDKVRQPAETSVVHETAKFIAYAHSLGEVSLRRTSSTPD